MVVRRWLVVLSVLAMVAAGCGSGDADETAGADDTAEAAQSGDADASAEVERPVVVVTTNILGDVVANVAGGQVEVVTIMPVGTDPHDFQPSAAQVAQMGDADVLISNGEAFEEGLLDVIEGVAGDGVPVYEAISAVETIEFGAGGHEHHSDEEHSDGEDHDHDDHSDEEHSDGEDHDHDDHSDEEHSDEENHDHDHDHGHDGDDPHFFQDPARMALAADGVADFLVANLDGIDTEALTASAEAYIAELEALDAEIEATLDGVANRVLVTNHDALGYFAERYRFEVAGTVIPSGSTTDGTSAQQLAELAELIQAEGVAAIFTETTDSGELANTLAEEVGSEISVVELFTGSLGEAGSGGETYLDMMRTNAERIAAALAT